jgi:hypothetical protein
MTDRGAVATARAVGERLADDLKRGDIAAILRLPELELPDRRAAIKETEAVLERLPERDLAVLAEAFRELPRRLGAMEPITVPHDAPIPDRLVDAVPFLERERRQSPLVLTIAVVSIVGLVAFGLLMTMRRMSARPTSGADLAPGGGTSSLAGSGTAMDPPGTGPTTSSTTRPEEEGV